ncbi:MAG TPA: hypothetical protein VGC64_11935 [Pyrinomonadaceae bacterium]|jgi:hypothetical protein
MSLKLYCNRYAHFKDTLVCSVACPYRTRCQDFALFYDANRESINARVAEYYTARSSAPERRGQRHVALAAAVELRQLLRLEVKIEMAEAQYIWIGKDDQAELLELDEVIRRAERGSKAKNIYKVAQEMELRFQLVPRKRIEKAKRIAAADAERAAARRKPLRPVPVEKPAPLAPLAAAESLTATTPQTPARRSRTRVAKAVGER